VLFTLHEYGWASIFFFFFFFFFKKKNFPKESGVAHKMAAFVEIITGVGLYNIIVWLNLLNKILDFSINK
jgi:hypothetical protein